MFHAKPRRKANDSPQSHRGKQKAGKELQKTSRPGRNRRRGGTNFLLVLSPYDGNISLSLRSLKIDRSPSKQATGFSELSNASVVDFVSSSRLRVQTVQVRVRRKTLILAFGCSKSLHVIDKRLYSLRGCRIIDGGPQTADRAVSFQPRQSSLNRPGEEFLLELGPGQQEGDIHARA